MRVHVSACIPACRRNKEMYKCKSYSSTNVSHTVHVYARLIDTRRLSTSLSRPVRGDATRLPREKQYAALASHDKHEPRKSRDGEHFRSAAEASGRVFQSGALSVSRSVSERPPCPARRRPTPLDSLMERCRSNCPRLIFCNRKQFRSATCVSICGLTHSGRGRRRPFPRIFLFSETRGLCYLQVFVTDAHAFCDRSWTKRSA